MSPHVAEIFSDPALFRMADPDPGGQLVSRGAQQAMTRFPQRFRKLSFRGVPAHPGETPPRRLRATRRRVALVAVGALVAAGLSTVTAMPAFAAVSCQVDYTLRSAWATGFTADLTLHNTGDPLTSWTIGFAFAGHQQISQPPWNAGTWSQTGNQVSISNAGWNGNVASGGTVSGVGFNASFSGTNTNPTAFTVNGVACGATPPTPSLVVTPTSVNVPE